MNFQQLRCFLAVAEHLNFTQAAKQLCLGQPSLSRQIAELEKELGVQLFVRNHRAVKLTAAGSVLYKYSSPIVAKSAEAVEMTRQAGLGLYESLKIGYLGFEYKLLPQAIKIYHQNYPNIVFSATRYTWHELDEALVANELDVAFTLSTGLETFSGIEWKNISRNPLTVVLPCSHRLAGQTKIKLSALAEEPFIQTSQETSPLANAINISLCLKNGFSPNLKYSSPYVETVLMLVEAGIGVAILPRHASFFLRPNLSFIDIDDEDAYVDTVIAWKQESTNPALFKFLDEIKKMYSLGEM